MTHALLDTSTQHDSLSRSHDCADCARKERVYLSAPNGRQTAAVWRCRTLSQKTQAEVIVQPHENCFTHKSLTDYFLPLKMSLVR